MDSAGKGFVYLASPYSHPDAYIRRFRALQVADVTVRLLRAKVWTYSPIVHNHGLVCDFRLEMGWDVWQHFDRALIDACRFMAILQMPEWEKSEGIKAELQYCLTIRKSVVYATFSNLDEIIDAWNAL